MLNDPTVLAAGAVLFLAFVVRAVAEYRAWRRAKRAERSRMIRQRVEESLRVARISSHSLEDGPGNSILELREIIQR